MARVPVGTVSLLFTDIEGSTRLLQALGERYAALLADHHRLLGAAFREQDGVEQGTAGDGLYFTFPSARAAVSAAVAAQRALLGHAWPDDVAVRVRMGVHTGEPASHEFGYVGLDVHRAARIAAAGHGGQVLVSQTTRDLVADDLPGDVTLLDLGEHRLKDLTGPQRLFQVVAPGLPAEFPALRTVDTHPGNLPRQLTTFVGRDHEIAEGRRLLASAPLLTLTGPGGVGKTRLALRLAQESLDGVEDGAWLVELGAVADPAFVPSSVAATLGIVEQPGRALVASIVDHLRTRRLLLVLDNCEHLLAASADLAHAVLRDCPSTRILATSQESFGIAGEAVLPVPSLSLPDEASITQRDRLLECEAVQLFTQRAQAVLPSFQLTTQNARPVAQICRRLDGIPLALELAAARLRALSVEQVADRLDDRFRLLTGGSRLNIPRHQTLRAAVDWSFDLLSDDERALLRRLSVFAGSFGLEAAEAVGMGRAVVEGDVLDLLARLVDKSLVVAEASGAEARYRLSEIIRQYAHERLLEAGEGEEARRRHRDWHLALVERAAPALQRGPEAGGWLDRLDLEHDNLRAALEWSADQPDERDAGLRMAAGLWHYCEIRGHAQEGRGWLERMLEATRGETTVIRANALTGAGILATMQGDHAAAAEFHEASLALYRRLGDPHNVANAGNNLANAALQGGDLDLARRLYQEAIDVASQAGDRQGLAFGLMNMADVLQRQGDEAAARAQFEEAVATFRQFGDRWGEAFALDSFGLVVSRHGDQASARAYLEQALAISQALGDQRGVARTLTHLADVADREGDPRRARGLHLESLAVRRSLGDMPGTAMALEKLAFVVMADDPEAAARLLGAAEGLRETIRARVPPAARADREERLAELEQRLGLAAYEAARLDGRSLDLEAALATLPPLATPPP